jgi:hypothetical protein
VHVVAPVVVRGAMPVVGLGGGAVGRIAPGTGGVGGTMASGWVATGTVAGALARPRDPPASGRIGRASAALLRSGGGRAGSGDAGPPPAGPVPGWPASGPAGAGSGGAGSGGGGPDGPAHSAVTVAGGRLAPPAACGVVRECEATPRSLAHPPVRRPG